MAAAMWNRQQLCSMLGASETEYSTLYRQGVVSASHLAGDKHTRLFDLVDVAAAAVAVQGFRLGVRGRQLASLVTAVRARAARLAPGWQGWVVFDGAGAELCSRGDDLGALALSYHSPTALLVVPVRVPVAP